MTEADTLRWGDADLVQFTPQALAAAFLVNTKQLVAAKWRWPLVWGLRVIILPALNSGETATFTVDVQVTVGSGQNSTTAHFIYLVAPAAGVYPVCINDLQQIPAQDIQVTVKVTGTPVGTAGVAESIQVGVYVAPMTEPHGTTRLYEWMMTPPAAQGAPRFLDGRIGFQDDPLYYQNTRGRR